ncbi:MAG: c-type cytochrome [Deltaproteobacteria bacterium]|nr:c-type cytochrome [Deltaproteobacteria bacterium]
MRTLLILLAALLLGAKPAASEAEDWRANAQTALHLLDYVGVDYPEFVKDGVVLDEAEYQEQLEFASRVVALLPGLPDRPERARLIADAESVEKLVRAKGPGAQVSAATADLRWALIAAYGLAVAPRHVPELARGKKLHAASCESCHGADGKGDGSAGAGLEPAPADFTDAARIAQRSVYGLYNTITLGVGGTGMAAYTQLSDEDRWALAFFVSQLAFTPQELDRGESAWKTGKHAETFSDLGNVATLSSDEVAARFGADAADAQRWLRAHPEALAAVAASPIDFTVKTLRESLLASRGGDSATAQRLALTAYLEGFELIEASLDAVDSDLRTRIEAEMMTYRTKLGSGEPAEDVERQLGAIVALLEHAQTRLEGDSLGAGALFTSSLLILFREGLEAILVLAAIIAFLVKSERRDSLPWVHLGWGLALVAGAATWFVATYVVAISGASREMTEAVSALLAAGVLLYVGVWLHSNANSRAWQSFLRDRVGGALNRRTLWALASVSFLAVYRELFEIVLFYQALWAQAGDAGGGPLLAGMGSAVGLLALVGWGVFRYGLRLPIGQFFKVTSVVLAALAVIFVGQGVSALQEAGAVGVNAVAFVRVPALGIFPTAQTLAAQVAAALLVAGSFVWAGRHRIASAESADAR